MVIFHLLPGTARRPVCPPPLPAHRSHVIATSRRLAHLSFRLPDWSHVKSKMWWADQSPSRRPPRRTVAPPPPRPTSAPLRPPPPATASVPAPPPTPSVLPAESPPEAAALRATAAGIERLPSPTSGSNDDDGARAPDTTYTVRVSAGSGLWAGEAEAEALVRRTPNTKRRRKGSTHGSPRDDRVFPFPRAGTIGDLSRRNVWREGLAGERGVPRASLGPPHSPPRSASRGSATNAATGMCVGDLALSVRRRRQRDAAASAALAGEPGGR